MKSIDSRRTHRRAILPVAMVLMASLMSAYGCAPTPITISTGTGAVPAPAPTPGPGRVMAPGAPVAQNPYPANPPTNCAVYPASPGCGPVNVQPQPQPPASAVGSIIFAHSGSCLAVPNGNQADNVQLVQMSCNNLPQQKFQAQIVGNGPTGPVVTLRATHSGKCLDLGAGNPGDGAALYQRTCNYSASQQFSVRQAGNGYENLIAQHSGKCIDVPGGNPANWVGVHQWTCDGSAEQAILFQ